MINLKTKIINMCNNILETTSEFYDDSNGPYYAICNLCDSSISYPGNVPHKTMEDIQHDSDCPWIIAPQILDEIENIAKSGEKDENGKVIKTNDFLEPEPRLQEILDKRINK